MIITLTDKQPRYPLDNGAIDLSGINEIKLFDLGLACPAKIVFTKGVKETSYDLNYAALNDPEVLRGDKIKDNDGFYFTLSNPQSCKAAATLSFLLG